MRHSQSGFTLVEIMVAITILAGLSLLTGQAIQSGVLGRERINREIMSESEVRDTLRVMERDINLAFHHRDVFTEMLNQIERDKAKAQAKAGNPPSGGATGGQGGATPGGNPQVPSADQSGGAQERKPPKKLTHFLGEVESVHFTSLTNVRLRKDAQESDQAEVGYFLRDCRKRISRGEGASKARSSRCLVRRLSPYIDDDVAQGGNEVALLPNVKEFKLRYFGPGRDEWVNSWKTGDGGDALSKENFPYAVEVSIIVHDDTDPKSRRVAMTMVAPIQFPNNPSTKKEGSVDGGR